MAIQKKSLIGKTQSAKKALVAKRVSADTPKAEQVKAPSMAGLKNRTPLVVHHKALNRIAPLRMVNTFKMK